MKLYPRIKKLERIATHLTCEVGRVGINWNNKASINLTHATVVLLLFRMIPAASVRRGVQQ